MKGLFDNLKDTLGSLTGGDQNSDNKKDSPLGGMGGMLGATAVGGLLGALLGGSKGVQKAAKNVAVVGAGAAAAGLAYTFLQKWRQNRNAPGEVQAQTPVPAPAPAPASAGFGASSYQAPAAPAAVSYEDQGALLMLKAMIFSARADGHIDADEQAMIEKCSADFGPAVQQALHGFMTCPLDPNAIAAEVKNPELAADIYKLSAAVIFADNFMEQSYLAGLAQSLGLDANQKAALDQEAAALRAQIKAS